MNTEKLWLHLPQPGHVSITRYLVKLVILHDIKNDEGIRLFFMDVWEHYVKVRLPAPILLALGSNRQR